MITQDSIDRILGANVVDSKGDKIGSVGQLYLDDRTGEPSWVTVNTGLFGANETFVPLHNANFDGEDIVVAYEKDFVKDAPNESVEDGHLSVEQEEQLYRYYSIDAAAPAAAAGQQGQHAEGQYVEGQYAQGEQAQHAQAGAAHGTDDISVREERLNVGTETVETGRARIRKYVTTENEQVSVPVSKERLVVDREPVEGGRAVPGGLDANPGEEFDHEVTLREERPVVAKETVETERVHVGTETVTENQTVSGEVSREHVEVEEGVQGDIRPEDRA